MGVNAFHNVWTRPTGPTGERKTLVPNAANGHAFKSTYGYAFSERKTDVCRSLLFLSGSTADLLRPVPVRPTVFPSWPW